MSRKISVLLLMLCVLLTGCFDASEVDDSIYIVGLGLDLSPSDSIRMTIQYPLYKGGDSGGGSGGSKSSGGGDSNSKMVGETIIDTIDAPTLLEGIEILDVTIPRKISLMHMKMVFISEALARKGVGALVAPLARYREIRSNMAMIITKDSAENVMRENKLAIGSSTLKDMELLVYQMSGTGLSYNTTFHDFSKALLSSGEQASTIYAAINKTQLSQEGGQEKGSDEQSGGQQPENKTEQKQGENKPSGQQEQDIRPQFPGKGQVPGEIKRSSENMVDYLGMSVFHDEKMVGTLDSYETRYALMLTGRYKKGIFTFTDPEDANMMLPIDIIASRAPTYKVKKDNDVVQIEQYLELDGNVDAIQSRINYEKLEKLQQLEQYIEAQLDKNINAVIQKTQKQYNTDIFGYGLQVAHKFGTIQAFEEFMWLDKYKDAKIHANVKLRLRRTGTMVKSYPFSKMKGNSEEVSK
ncbi:MAG: Ger(x)C family spore germination protein [Hyphomonadaceae bacterium]|nr:Ger(x)C family spore germination protein [Clostridia bacterium]